MQTSKQTSFVIRLAIAIVVAQCLYSFVASLISEIIVPPLGLIADGKSLPSLFYNLTPDKRVPSGPIDSIEKASYAGASVIAYGAFLSTLLVTVTVISLAACVLRWLDIRDRNSELATKLQEAVASSFNSQPEP